MDIVMEIPPIRVKALPDASSVKIQRALNDNIYIRE